MAGDATGTADQYLRLLDNETRWEIVRELSLTFDPTHPEETGLAFSELFRRVSIEDSGAFTYHLEKLLGVLVSKDDDGEYHPILGRVKPAQHLYAWTRPWDETEEWVETDHECHRSDCSRQVHLVYNELLKGRGGCTVRSTAACSSTPTCRPPASTARTPTRWSGSSSSGTSRG